MDPRLAARRGLGLFLCCPSEETCWENPSGLLLTPALRECPALVPMGPHPSDQEPSLPKTGGRRGLHLTGLCGVRKSLPQGWGVVCVAPCVFWVGSPSSSRRPAPAAFTRPFPPEMSTSEMKRGWHLFLTLLLGALGAFLWGPSVRVGG